MIRLKEYDHKKFNSGISPDKEEEIIKVLLRAAVCGKWLNVWEITVLGNKLGYSLVMDDVRVVTDCLYESTYLKRKITNKEVFYIAPREQEVDTN